MTAGHRPKPPVGQTRSPITVTIIKQLARLKHPFMVSIHTGTEPEPQIVIQPVKSRRHECESCFCQEAVAGQAELHTASAVNENGKQSVFLLRNQAELEQCETTLLRPSRLVCT